MKLELKHIAPYLPYKLALIFEKSGRIINLGGLQQTDAGNLIFINLYGQFYEQTVWNFKPILRPLSDLTKEIEVNGEKFVPMVELFKIASDQKKLIEYTTVNQAEGVGIKFINNDLFLYHAEYNCFAHSTSPNRKSLFVGFQLDLFNKLFEWHFDIFSLLENGLAVDINSPKELP